MDVGHDISVLNSTREAGHHTVLLGPLGVLLKGSILGHHAVVPEDGLRGWTRWEGGICATLGEPSQELAVGGEEDGGQ